MDNPSPITEKTLHHATTLHSSIAAETRLVVFFLRRLCGGLSLALFRKAQRLPCAKLTNETEGHDEEVNKVRPRLGMNLQSKKPTVVSRSIGFGSLVPTMWMRSPTVVHQVGRANCTARGGAHTHLPGPSRGG